MNERMNFLHEDANSGKVNNYLGDSGQKWAWDSSNFNEWINLPDFFHANTYLRKLKVTLIVIRWAWTNMGVSF